MKGILAQLGNQAKGQTQAKPKKGAPRFTTAGCPKVEPSKWAALLLLNQPIQHEFKFGKDCDLEGPIEFRRAGFPVDLKVRNIEGADRVQGRVVPEAEPDLMKNQIIVRVQVPEGKFSQSGSDLMTFDADYAVYLDLAGDIRENKGGTVRLSHYKGAAAKGSVPVLFTR